MPAQPSALPGQLPPETINEIVSSFRKILDEVPGTDGKTACMKELLKRDSIFSERVRAEVNTTRNGTTMERFFYGHDVFDYAFRKYRTY